LPETTDDEEVEPAKPTGLGEKAVAGVKAAWYWTRTCLNPPLVGGLAGIIFGVIPWTQYELFDADGWLSPCVSLSLRLL
jgi:auxin efflux carrier family protein